MTDARFAGRVKPGTNIPVINKPSDAPTVYVDSFLSMSSDNNVAKISFVETLPSPEGLVEGRVVLNLVISRANMKALSQQLADSIEKTEAMEAEDKKLA